MATAMAFPEGQQGKRNDLFPGETSSSEGYTRGTLSKARYVLRNSPMVEGERYPRRCLSTNVRRRHNRRAQRAMRLAFVYPETQHGGDRRSDGFKVQICTLNLNKRERTDLNMCRFVLHHNESLARLILKWHPNYTLNKAAKLHLAASLRMGDWLRNQAVKAE